MHRPGFTVMGLIASAVLLGLFIASTAAYARAAFQAGCDLPYARIAQQQPIDSLCPAYGPADPASVPAMEFLAKNNLCATGPTATVTLADFLAMQPLPDRAGIPTGRRNGYVSNRQLLRNIYTTSGGQTIGEGSRVVLRAYVSHAQYSDTDKGENVNCNQSGNEPNDIHISVVGTPGARPCSGVVAEMIPHYRPAAWTRDNLNALGTRPVRITGHLFFDSRHHVSTCTNPHAGDPARVSLWEIHPVYALEVCRSTSLSACAVADERMWVPLDQWAGRHP